MSSPSPSLSASSVSASRLVVGAGMGLSGPLHPVYVFELCGPGCPGRGAFNASGPVCVTIGILASFVLGAALGYDYLQQK